MAKQGSKDFKFHKNCNNDNKFGLKENETYGGTEKEKRKCRES